MENITKFKRGIAHGSLFQLVFFIYYSLQLFYEIKVSSHPLNICNSRKNAQLHEKDHF